MKRIIITLISILLVLISVRGQSVLVKDTCLFPGLKEIDFFIPGSIDTIQENGIKTKAINAAQLVNGFDLLSRDSLVEIISFQLVFDNMEDGNLYAKMSKGNKITDDEKHLFSLSKIKEASLITIEHIVFRYKEICYRANGQVYLCR